MESRIHLRSPPHQPTFHMKPTHAMATYPADLRMCTVKHLQVGRLQKQFERNGAEQAHENMQPCTERTTVVYFE